MILFFILFVYLKLSAAELFISMANNFKLYYTQFILIIMKKIIKQDNINNAKKHDKRSVFLAVPLFLALSCSPIQEENSGHDFSCGPRDLIRAKKTVSDYSNNIIAREGDTITLECGIDVKIEDLDFKDGLRKVKIIKQKENVSFATEYDGEKLIAISCESDNAKVKLNFDKNGYELFRVILSINNKEVALKNGEAIPCKGDENTYGKDATVNLKFVNGFITSDNLLVLQFFIEPIDSREKKIVTFETPSANYPSTPFLIPFTEAYLKDYKTCE